MTWVLEKVTYGFILMPSKLMVLPGQGVRTESCNQRSGTNFLFDTLDTRGHPHTIDYLVETMQDIQLKRTATELLKKFKLLGNALSGVKMGFDQNLAKVATSLVSAASSSGGLERCFSTLGTTYGKVWTSMGVEKAGKLAFMYRQRNKK